MPSSKLQSSLLRAAEQAEIVRWIEFQNSVLLFLLVPGDPESGAVYILDRKTGTSYCVDFDDKQYGGYSVSQLEEPERLSLPRPCGAARPLANRFQLVGGSGHAAASPRLTEKIFRVITYTNIDRKTLRGLCSTVPAREKGGLFLGRDIESATPNR